MRHPVNDRPTPLDALVDLEHPEFDIEEAADRIATVRADPVASRFLDLNMLDRLQCLQKGLLAAQELLEKLKGVIEKFTAPPLYPAIFVQFETLPEGPRALVYQGATERIVGFGDGVDRTALRTGDPVYLAREQNVIVGRAPAEFGRTGETCNFERRTGDGRLLVKSRDEEIVVHPLPALAETDLKPGALLRWDRNTRFASEQIGDPSGSEFLLEETPRESFDDIGGLGPQIASVTKLLHLHFKHPEIARMFQLPAKGSILLHGPSGTGKTLMAKALANWMAKNAPGRRSFFMNFKPAQLHSRWYSQSEAHYREAFQLAREKATANPGSIVVMFFDEVDAIGAIRGAAHNRINDNVLTAFLAELDGLAERGDIVVIGATNRREALDPALLRPGRFGDLVVKIPRPDRRAARDIFTKHLRSDMKFARNGHGDDFAATRTEIIDAAVSTLFAPNAANELATIMFRDGKRRVVRAGELVSGAVIRNIINSANTEAGARYAAAVKRAEDSRDPLSPSGDAGGLDAVVGECGLVWSDVALAIEQWFETAAGELTPENCRHHLSGLPHDLDVVNVELVTRKVARPQRYLNAA